MKRIWLIILGTLVLIILAIFLIPKLLPDKKLGATYYTNSLEEAEVQNIDFEKFPTSRLMFDSNGVRLTPYDVEATQVRYNPVSITHYALAAWNSYLATGEESSKEKFLNQVKWLQDNKKPLKDAYVWEYTWDLEAFSLKAPWISALSQGEAISVMLRAWQMTGNEEYLKTARGAFNSFKYKTDEGGVEATDIFWFEEYPNSSKIHVLNGFIYSLFGIREYWETTHDWRAWWDWQKANSSLAKNLPQYDAGFDSTYDRSRPIFVQYKFYLRGDFNNLEKIIFLDDKKEIYQVQAKDVKDSAFNLPLRSLAGTNELPADFALKANFVFSKPQETELAIWIERGNQIVSIGKTAASSNEQIIDIPDRFYSRTFSGPHYNKVVADQLGILSNLTGSKIFKNYQEKFNQYPHE